MNVKTDANLLNYDKRVQKKIYLADKNEKKKIIFTWKMEKQVPECYFSHPRYKMNDTFLYLFKDLPMCKYVIEIFFLVIFLHRIL